jgi:hypothetical protein
MWASVRASLGLKTCISQRNQQDMKGCLVGPAGLELDVQSSVLARFSQ